MPLYQRLTLIFLLTVFLVPAFGQEENAPDTPITLSGQVLDAETGESLPAASIQLKNTYRGSITNEDGFFELRVPPEHKPESDPDGYRLIFRFIGYETKEVSVQPDTPQTVELRPSAQELEELVFTGEDVALHIMERVIARKQLWRADLKSWRAEAYTRNTLANADSLVSVSESLTLSWWKRDKGIREYVVDQQQTRNLLTEQNFAGIQNLPNFYDDEIEIAGFRIIGVTHPDAFRFYDFKVMGQRGEGESKVYDIEVIPATRLQPSFKGRVSVLAEEYALLEVELKPADMVFFPPPVQEADFSYRQQFSNYGGDFWLPVDLRISGRVKVGIPGLRFPEFRLNLASAITDYEVNPAVPDSVFGSARANDFTLTRLSDEQRLQMGRSLDSGDGSSARSIPLNEEESEAYARIDSTQAVGDAFQPSGILSGFVGNGGGDEGPPPSGFRARLSLSPEVRFNRVEGLYGGVRPEFRLPAGLRLQALAGYASAGERLAYGGGLHFRSPILAEESAWRPRLHAQVAYRNDVRPRIESALYPALISSVSMLSGGSDYLDYYGRERIRLHTSVFFDDALLTGRRLRGSIALSSERQRALRARSSYSFAGGVQQRANAPVHEGVLNSMLFSIGTSAGPAPFGFAGSNTTALTIEHADPGFLGGDFSFTRYEGRLDIRVNTFLQRRFLPNTLDIRMQGFTYQGDVPPQRFGAFDGRISGFSAFGSFRTLQNRMSEGQQGAAVFWEHNFRTAPLELLSLNRLAKSGIGILIHGASGRTWLDAQGREALSAGTVHDGFRAFTPAADDGWRHELGVSVNGIFSILRIDATWRLDQPGFFGGISAARVF